MYVCIDYGCVNIWLYGLGLGGLVVMCSPRDPRFAGSNQAEVDGFSQDIKILSPSLAGGTLSWGVPTLGFQAR